MTCEPIPRRIDALPEEAGEASGEVPFEAREPVALKGLDGEHVLHVVGRV